MIVRAGLRRAVRRLKAIPLIQRYYHPLMIEGVAFVGRHPRLHLAWKSVYRLAPGLQPYLRRFFVEPASRDPATASLALQLRLVPATSIAVEGVVTLEELACIARTL